MPMDSDEVDIQRKELDTRSTQNAPQQPIGPLVKRDGEHSCSTTLPTKSRTNKRKLDRTLIQRSTRDFNTRRWCVYEWFYSAIDYPWFAKKEFVEYLTFAGLGHITRLSRVEWGVLRSSLGKPRRLSKHFLRQERKQLDHYRESVRNHYSSTDHLGLGKREGLRIQEKNWVTLRDLARPLTVGQRVIAIHPRSREVHNGNVLTVEHDRCKIQFDRPELGVEFVKDIDCMPMNPMENIPTSLNKRHKTLKQFQVNETEDKIKERKIS